MALPFWSTSPQVWLELLAIDSPKPLRLTYTATLPIEQDYRGEADGTTLAQRSRGRSRRRASLLKVSFPPRGSLPIGGASIDMADDGPPATKQMSISVFYLVYSAVLPYWLPLMV